MHREAVLAALSARAHVHTIVWSQTLLTGLAMIAQNAVE